MKQSVRISRMFCRKDSVAERISTAIRRKRTVDGRIGVKARITVPMEATSERSIKSSSNV